MGNTTYVPKCYAREREGNYGKFIAISFDAKELIAFVQANTNARGEFKITVSQRREPSDKGITHSVALDTFEPRQRGEAPPPSRRANPNPPPERTPPPEEDSSDVPF